MFGYVCFEKFEVAVSVLTSVLYDLMFEGCADDFHCTNQGHSPVIDRVDDAKEMHNTRKAFSLLGEGL